MWSPAPYRSVKEIVNFLNENPFQTESQIQEQVFGYFRNSSFQSNKKYAEMLRRGLDKGYYKRILLQEEGDRRAYFKYYIENN